MGCQRTDTSLRGCLDLLAATARSLAVPLSDDQVAAFAAYASLLQDYGRRFNLTSVLDWEGIQARHFGESLALGAALRDAGLLSGQERLVDVGSGAGFPGLPLAIAWPDLRVTLAEATGKKVAFLETVKRELGLRGVEVVHGRAEELAHTEELRERFNIATARAVARLASLAEILLPFVRTGGAAAALKGSRIEAEIAEAGAAIRRCGGGATTMLELPASESRLRLVVMRKARPTPASLPRPAGSPVHNPIR